MVHTEEDDDDDVTNDDDQEEGDVDVQDDAGDAGDDDHLRGKVADVEGGHRVVGSRLLALLARGRRLGLLGSGLLHRCCHSYSLKIGFAKYNFADGQFNRSLFPVFSFFSAVLSFFLCFFLSFYIILGRKWVENSHHPSST